MDGTSLRATSAAALAQPCGVAASCAHCCNVLRGSTAGCSSSSSVACELTELFGGIPSRLQDEILHRAASSAVSAAAHAVCTAVDVGPALAHATQVACSLAAGQPCPEAPRSVFDPKLAHDWRECSCDMCARPGSDIVVFLSVLGAWLSAVPHSAPVACEARSSFVDRLLACLGNPASDSASVLTAPGSTCCASVGRAILLAGMTARGMPAEAARVCAAALRESCARGVPPRWRVQLQATCAEEEMDAALRSLHVDECATSLSADMTSTEGASAAYFLHAGSRTVAIECEADAVGSAALYVRRSLAGARCGACGWSGQNAAIETVRVLRARRQVAPTRLPLHDGAEFTKECCTGARRIELDARRGGVSPALFCDDPVAALPAVGREDASHLSYGGLPTRSSTFGGAFDGESPEASRVRGRDGACESNSDEDITSTACDEGSACALLPRRGRAEWIRCVVSCDRCIARVAGAACGARSPAVLDFRRSSYTTWALPKLAPLHARRPSIVIGELWLDGASILVSEFVTAVRSSARMLRILSLRRCAVAAEGAPRVPAAAIVDALRVDSPALQFLDVAYSVFLDVGSMVELLNMLPHLQHLDVSGLDLTDNRVDALREALRARGVASVRALDCSVGDDDRSSREARGSQSTLNQLHYPLQGLGMGWSCGVLLGIESYAALAELDLSLGHRVRPDAALRALAVASSPLRRLRVCAMEISLKAILGVLSSCASLNDLAVTATGSGGVYAEPLRSSLATRVRTVACARAAHSGLDEGSTVVRAPTIERLFLCGRGVYGQPEEWARIVRACKNTVALDIRHVSWENVCEAVASASHLGQLRTLSLVWSSGDAGSMASLSAVRGLVSRACGLRALWLENVAPVDRGFLQFLATTCFALEKVRLHLDDMVDGGMDIPDDWNAHGGGSGSFRVELVGYRRRGVLHCSSTSSQDVIDVGKVPYERKVQVLA